MSTRVLGWSAQQGRILTGGGRAEALYTPERGFPFDETELPHYHLRNGTTREQFRAWRAQARVCSSLVGVWSRPLFVGGWEHTTDADERVHNMQTPSIFIDLRIPLARPDLAHRGSLGECSDDELRALARQHVFCGYTLPSSAAAPGGSTGGGAPLVCTRHHAIDWNYIGAPRPRPNKWRVELMPAAGAASAGATGAGAAGEDDRPQQWKEWSYATDEHGQSYYWERWARIAGDEGGVGRVLALRRLGAERDAFLLLVGDHFSYVRARARRDSAGAASAASAAKSGTLFALVDDAVARGDRAEAEHWLDLDGGHGLRSAGWRIDSSTQPWREGAALHEPSAASGAAIDGQLAGDVPPNAAATAAAAGASAYVVLDGAVWEVLECSGIDGGAQGLLSLLSGPSAT